MQKLFKHDFSQNRLNFCDKMDIPVQMTIIDNLKYRHAIRLKFRDKFLISLTKLKLEAKASTGQCFTIRESLL